MVNSIAAGTARMKSAEQHLRDGASWSGWCESFVYRFGGFASSRDSATLAYRASGAVVSTDHAKAPAGAIHWWSDKGNANGAGHVAVSLGHDLAAMASARVTSAWGKDSGTITMSAYNAATSSFLTYLGWTYDFIGERITDVDVWLKAQAAAVAKAKADAAAKEAAAQAKAKADAAAKEAAHVAATTEEDTTMPVYFRGDHAPEVFHLNRATGTKRHVSHAEWTVAGIGQSVHVIAQADADAIPAG